MVEQTSEERQTTIANHNYDALINSISIGADPDVFAYWHSSQARSGNSYGLNFSEYNNPKADEALEAARSRTDPENRALKYQPFLQQWIEDNPALLLYQPKYVVAIKGKFSGFETEFIASPTGRYVGVTDWKVREKLE